MHRWRSEIKSCCWKVPVDKKFSIKTATFSKTFSFTFEECCFPSLFGELTWLKLLVPVLTGIINTDTITYTIYQERRETSIYLLPYSTYIQQNKLLNWTNLPSKQAQLSIMQSRFSPCTATHTFRPSHASSKCRLTKWPTHTTLPVY